MRKKLFIAGLLFLISTSIYAQVDSAQASRKLNKIDRQIIGIKKHLSSVDSTIRVLLRENESFKEKIYSLSSNNKILKNQFDSLNALLLTNKRAIDKLNKDLVKQKNEVGEKIQKNQETTTQKINSLDASLSRNTLYWVIAILAVALICVIFFIYLKKKISKNQSSVTKSIENTRKELEQEAINLDEKLISILETQMKLLEEEKPIKTQKEDGKSQDHSLALKVADEIVRIEKNLSNMDEGTKGLKQLSKAVQRIKDNFVANGYEMIDLIGKEFDEGMKVIANFVPDENLEPGERIITRIIKPQINYNGVMIQAGQVEVSQGD